MKFWFCMLRICVCIYSCFVENHPIWILDDRPLISEVVLSQLGSLACVQSRHSDLGAQSLCLHVFSPHRKSPDLDPGWQTPYFWGGSITIGLLGVRAVGTQWLERSVVVMLGTANLLKCTLCRCGHGPGIALTCQACVQWGETGQVGWASPSRAGSLKWTGPISFFPCIQVFSN
jgi:hypothetical protein